MGLSNILEYTTAIGNVDQGGLAVEPAETGAIEVGAAEHHFTGSVPGGISNRSM